jgi:hypothetical protein
MTDTSNGQGSKSSTRSRNCRSTFVTGRGAPRNAARPRPPFRNRPRRRALEQALEVSATTLAPKKNRPVAMAQSLRGTMAPPRLRAGVALTRLQHRQRIDRCRAARRRQ